jgi:glycosyltransferase involved in cell wall biosynthesis
VPVEKTSVVYLGFGLDRQEPAILPAPRRPFFLFVGLRGGYKNFDRLVSAYAACSKLRNEYDLVAFGGGGFSSKERDVILSHGLGEQVHQQGGDDSVLSALYRQAALFVYPSLYEGFGIPPLEAMSLDCPVVCSNTSSIPEVVGDAAVQFDPNDVESIGSALRSVAFDPQCRAELRLRGQSRIAEFSWRKCAMETLDVYQKVLA